MRENPDCDLQTNTPYLNVDCAVAVSSLQDHYPDHTVLEAAEEMRARGEGAYRSEGGRGVISHPCVYHVKRRDV